jgi:hypothetical protein
VSAPEELEGGFSRRAVRWIVSVAAVSFIIAVLLSAFGQDLESRPSPGANTFSESALGHQALAELLRSLGLGVVSRQSPGGGGTGPGRPLIVAEPVETRRLKDILQAAASHKAAVVLVLPKWIGVPKKGRPEWVGTVKPVSEPEVLRALRDADLGLDNLTIRRGSQSLPCTGFEDGRRFQVESQPIQLLGKVPGFEPVVECGGDLLVARRAGDPELIVISDPDVLNNQGLGRGDNAPLVVALLVERLGATGVIFDETVHGFSRTPGLLAEAFRFPLVLAVLQALVLVGTVLWAGMGRFGKPLPAAEGLAAGKEILIDNTAKLLASGGHTADSLATYFRQTTRAVAAHYFLPPDLPDRELVARLQRVTDSHGSRLDLAALERRIGRSSASARGRDERAARIARRLHQWRQEMMNGNRKSS